MNTPKNLNPKVHIKFEPMDPAIVTKTNNFFKGYMKGEYNFIKYRNRRYIMKDKIDGEAKLEMQNLVEELKIRDIIETVLEEKSQENQEIKESQDEVIDAPEEEVNEEEIEDD